MVGRHTTTICHPSLTDARQFGRLIAVNAVSLLIAVVANLALILQMVGRIPFGVGHSMTIIGWYLASLLLIGLVAAVPGHLQLPLGETRTFSQAYYYACFSAALYFVLSTMMVVTAYGVYIGNYSKEYKLTIAQRALMFQTVTFLGYLLAAAAVYARIEGWNFLDAVYWIDVTLFTIGFGDFAPQTHLGRSLFFPMSVGGILFVGLIVTSIQTLVLEAGSKKISTRNVEKARRQILTRFDAASGVLHMKGLRKTKRLGGSDKSELGRREQEFDLMRQVQRRAKLKDAIMALSLSVGCFTFLWFIGAVFFWKAESGTQDWTYFESLYFTWVSFLTIGYGDFYPQDNAAKPVFVFWSLLALPTLTVLIGAIGNSISEGISTLTLWLAEHVPTKIRAMAALRSVANEAKKGEHGAFTEAKPHGFMEDKPHVEGEKENDSQASAVRGMEQDIEAGDVSPLETKDAAAAKAYRLYLLLKELQTVVNHLDASPPREYSYAEWTWFLKLLGEDESKAKHHRPLTAVRDAEHTRESVGNVEAVDAEPAQGFLPEQWSWLGEKSPLMTANDEPRWVMERLMRVLARELKAMADEGRGVP